MVVLNIDMLGCRLKLLAREKNCILVCFKNHTFKDEIMKYQLCTFAKFTLLMRHD